jgi:hypothetical protein
VLDGSSRRALHSHHVPRHLGTFCQMQGAGSATRPTHPSSGH